MIRLHGRNLRRLALFLTSLLCTVLFSFALPSIWQPVNAASDDNAVNSSATYQSRSFVSRSFEQVRASHLEPNFYQ